MFVEGNFGLDVSTPKSQMFFIRAWMIILCGFQFSLGRGEVLCSDINKMGVL